MRVYFRLIRFPEFAVFLFFIFLTNFNDPNFEMNEEMLEQNSFFLLQSNVFPYERKKQEKNRYAFSKYSLVSRKKLQNVQQRRKRRKGLGGEGGDWRGEKRRKNQQFDGSRLFPLIFGPSLIFHSLHFPLSIPSSQIPLFFASPALLRFATMSHLPKWNDTVD